jgi:hypothetical protein
MEVCDVKSQVIDALRTVSSDRHKLVILLGAHGTGKTALLKQVAKEMGGVYVNLNLELTDCLLTLPRRKYRDGVAVHALIDDLCSELSPDGRPLMIDNVEVLFSPELGRVNPVDTFKRISRERPILLALPARRSGAAAEYSTIQYQDHMTMPLDEFATIEL